MVRSRPEIPSARTGDRWTDRPLSSLLLTHHTPFIFSSKSSLEVLSVVFLHSSFLFPKEETRGGGREALRSIPRDGCQNPLFINTPQRGADANVYRVGSAFPHNQTVRVLAWRSRHSVGWVLPFSSASAKHTAGRTRAQAPSEAFPFGIPSPLGVRQISRGTFVIFLHTCVWIWTF